jgi:two-component system cell cycle sensor histidine kinase/response regulator CckA
MARLQLLAIADTMHPDSHTKSANGRRRLQPAGRAAWLAPLVETAPVGIARVDPDGRIVDCNPMFVRLIGGTSDDVLGRRVADLVVRGDRDDLTRQLSKLVMGTARNVRLDNLRFPAAGEAARPVTLIAQALPAQGEVKGLALWAISDAAPRGGSPAALAQAQKMQAVGQLAGGIAHDFNNLLTGMLGFCDLLLLRHPPDDPSHEEIEQIRANAVRASNLVRQLLAFSRKQALEPVRLAVGVALADLSTLLRRLLGPAIELRLDHGCGDAYVEVDPGQFDQVIINLAVNARDAMPGGGILTIRTAEVSAAPATPCGDETMPAGRYIRIDVTDTGAGIPQEIIGNIFEPFFTTKEAGAGTGLGLATVFGIVRQTGGYIYVDSALGEGSTFSVFLPPSLITGAPDDDDPAPRSAPLSVSAAASPATHGRVVLLVDDEDPVRVFAARGLRRVGYRVLEAGSGEQAMDVLAAHPEAVDLLLTDVMMPGMDGHTLARLAHRSHPTIRVITMSGYQEDGLVDGRGLPLRRGFLQKPFTLAELTETVAASLSGEPAHASPATGGTEEA